MEWLSYSKSLKHELYALFNPYTEGLRRFWPLFLTSLLGRFFVFQLNLYCSRVQNECFFLSFVHGTNVFNNLIGIRKSIWKAKKVTDLFSNILIFCVEVLFGDYLLVAFEDICEQWQNRSFWASLIVKYMRKVFSKDIYIVLRWFLTKPLTRQISQVEVFSFSQGV